MELRAESLEHSGFKTGHFLQDSILHLIPFVLMFLYSILQLIPFVLMFL
jgi:hypothetical protein